MKNKKSLRYLLLACLLIGILLLYWGAVGVTIVPGIHAYGAKLDFYALENADDLSELVYHISGAEAGSIDERDMKKLTAHKDVIALGKAIPEYIAAYNEIQAEIDEEFSDKIAEKQAQIDAVNAEKTSVQKQIASLKKALNGSASDELDALTEKLSGIRASYDQLVAEKGAINADKDAVKQKASLNDDSIKQTAGFARLAVIYQLGEASFSQTLDYIAHSAYLILLIAGAALVLAYVALKRVFREKKVSTLPEEFLRMEPGALKISAEKRKFNPQQLLAPAALVILFILFSLLGGKSFLSLYNMKTILENSYYVGFMALGVTFVIMTGGIDLSLGTNMMCSALIGCYAYSAWGWPLWLAMWLVPLIGMFFGLCNGVMVAKLKLPPFIATLGTQMITVGFGQIITHVTTQYYPTLGSANYWFKTATYRVGTFPIGVVYLVLAFFVAWFLLGKTKFGRYALAIGSNEEAARLSGVATDSWKIAVYAVCGLFVGFAGLFYAAVNTVIIPGNGGGMEVDGIAAVVIGGTSMSGGSGTMIGTIIGVFIMSVLKSGLSSVGLQSHWQTFLTGFVVIGAVLLDQFRTASAQKVKIGKTPKIK